MNPTPGDLSLPADVAPEIELLFCFARVTLEPRHADRARLLLAQGVDWCRLIELAERHRALPLLRWHLHSIGSEAVPDAMRAELDERVAGGAARSLMLTVELRDILETFGDNGVLALPYKGPVVALAAYGNLALRHMRDLDLLVRPRDLARAQRLLADRGYRRITGIVWAPLHHALEYQCCFVRERDGAIVELHWTLMPRNVAARIRLNDLWARRREMQLLDATIPAPSHEDLVLALFMHGAKHRWNRLEWLVSVSELLRSHETDWTELRRRAKAWRVERMLRLSLLLVSELLGVGLPTEVRDYANADTAARTLAREALDELIASAAPPPEDVSSLRRFQLRAQDGVWQRLRYRSLRPAIGVWRAAAQFASVLSLGIVT